MKLFNPTTGGHPIVLDDLLLLQNAYKSGFTALASYLASNENCILSGVIIANNGVTVTCSSGYAYWQGEIYEVLSSTFPFSASGQYFFQLVQTVIVPSPDTYKNMTVNNVHFERQLQLVYYTTGLQGEYYSAFSRVGAGNVLSGMIIDWYGNVTVNFDATGVGIGSMGGYQICNGNNNSPDLRGRFIVMSTNVPSSGSPILNPSVGNYNFQDIGGEVLHTLNSSEMPSHTHTINDPGHTHSYSGMMTANHPAGSRDTEARYATPATTGSATTGITINNTGGGLPHENRPPYFALIKIMKS